MSLSSGSGVRALGCAVTAANCCCTGKGRQGKLKGEEVGVVDQVRRHPISFVAHTSLYVSLSCSVQAVCMLFGKAPL